MTRVTSIRVEMGRFRGTMVRGLIQPWIKIGRGKRFNGNGWTFKDSTTSGRILKKVAGIIFRRIQNGTNFEEAGNKSSLTGTIQTGLRGDYIL